MRDQQLLQRGVCETRQFFGAGVSPVVFVMRQRKIKTGGETPAPQKCSHVPPLFKSMD
jgi:hypothetical protein